MLAGTSIPARPSIQLQSTRVMPGDQLSGILPKTSNDSVTAGQHKISVIRGFKNMPLGDLKRATRNLQWAPLSGNANAAGVPRQRRRLCSTSRRSLCLSHTAASASI